MITHIVFFRMKDTSPEGLAKAKAVLMNMKGRIPFLKYIEVGQNVLESERNYDLALITRFDSLDDLNAYQVHPVHQEVIAYMSEARREPSVAVDFESSI